MRLFTWFIVRQLVADPLRSTATVAAVAVGIAVVIAIRLTNASSLLGFEAALDAVSGRTALEVTVPGVGIDEDRVLALAWLRTFGLVSPVVEGDALLRPAPGEPAGAELVRVLGLDILRDQPLRESFLVGTTSGREDRTAQFLTILTDPESIILPLRLASRLGLDTGSTVDLVVGDRAVPLVVRGLLGTEGPAEALDGNFALMDIAAAQLALGKVGRIDRLDLRLADDTPIDEAERTIAERLPEGLVVGRPSRRGVEVERMLAAFHFNLNALSSIALVVGLFLVYHTVSVSVIRRRAEIGMLRMIGTSRRTILGLFLGEALLLGLLGCAAGVPLGWGLAHGAVGLTSATVSVFWIATAARVPALDVGYVAMALGIGVPLAIVAAAVPSYEATRMTPVAAVRHEADLAFQHRLPRRYLAGVAGLFVLAGWLVTQPAIDGLPVFGILAVLAVLFGTALLVPVLLHRLQHWRHLFLLVSPVEGELARANLGGSIRRVAISVAALAVSLAMMVAIAVMVGSFRETVQYWVGQTLQADLFIGAGPRSPATSRAALGADVEAVIAAHPDVVAVDGFRGIDVPYDGSLVIVGAGRFDVLLEHGSLLFKAPEDGRRALAAAIGGPAVLVSESFSLKHSAEVGDTIELPTARGLRPFRVAAVYFDYSSDRGLVVMDEGTFARFFDDRRPSSLSAYLSGSADPDRVRTELLATLGPDRPVFINTNAALRASVLEIFDSTFTITYALEAIAIAVSMFGIAATLLTLVLERRHELALLRLVGAERRHLRRMIMIEAGWLGVVSQGLGLAVGFVLSLILVYVINVQSFGWTIQFHLPVAFLVQSTLLIVAATVLAGLYPARLAGRFQLADLTVEE